MSNRAIDIIDLVAKSESAAVEFKRARGVFPPTSICFVREGGDKGGRWIVKKAGHWNELRT